MSSYALLVVAAVLLTVAAQHPGKQTHLDELRTQSKKFEEALKGKHGYVMNDASGARFLSRDGKMHRALCGKASRAPRSLLGEDEASRPPKHMRPHLLGEDEASRPPKHMRPHLLGQDEASRPPKNMRPHLLGKDKASRPPKHGRPHLLGEDEASRPPKHERPHLLGEDEASRPPKNMRPHLLGQDEASRPPKNMRPHLVGEDAASRPPTHSVQDIFRLLSKMLVHHKCQLQVQFHPQLGHPTHMNASACTGWKNATSAIAFPTVHIPHVSPIFCSKFQATTPMKVPVPAHLRRLHAAVKKQLIGQLRLIAAAIRGKGFPGLKAYIKAQHASKPEHRGIMTGNKPAVWGGVEPKPHGMMTGSNPAVWGGVHENKAHAAHAARAHDHSRHHGEGQADHRHHGEGPADHRRHRHHGSKLRHFLRRHRWVIPTTFAVAVVITLACVAVAVHYRRRRALAAASAESRALIVEEDVKKVPLEEQPSNFYINENCD